MAERGQGTKSSVSVASENKTNVLTNYYKMTTVEKGIFYIKEILNTIVKRK